MGEIFCVRKGSSTKPLKAAIKVEYPEGDKCTCINNNTQKVLTSKGIDKWIFPIPEVGVWKVISLNQNTEEEAFQDITVEENQLYDIVLSHWDGTLFELGDQYEKYTGGWSGVAKKHSSAWINAGTPQVSITANNNLRIYFSAEGKSGAVQINKDIDLTKWNKFCIAITSDSSSSGTKTWFLSAIDRENSFFHTDALSCTSFSTVKEGIYELDISSVDVPCNLILGFNVGYNTSGMTGSGLIDMHISKIWLE